ncbi:CHAT domain-containing protein [Fischerella sp. PCC 9605]|uniref:CHAT domain-containing protein n=1 Tax=Fischerella sp. PCC 9605 TaxID=1173024 RepID=UPI0004B0B570|nr:CHAT domain-containing protein [Fischerella sp. PCC 9605]
MALIGFGKFRSILQRLLIPKRIVKVSVSNVLLFTIIFSLTIIPSTFAKQVQRHSAHIQTSQSPATAQQLLEQGEALYQAGRFAEAVTVLQAANRIYQQEHNPFGQATALTNLSLVYQQLGSWTEASKAINTSLKLLGWDEKNQKLNLNAQKPKWLEVLAQTLDIQGGLQLAVGKADVSLETAKQAEQIWKQLNNNAGVTRSRINQAQALRVAGFYRRALNILKEVSQQLQNEPDSSIKAAALRSLGNALQKLGELEPSWQTLQQSLKISQNLQLTQEIATTAFSLGNTARLLGNTKDAIFHYQKAAEIAPNPLTKIQAQINLLSLFVDDENIAAAQALIPTIQSELASLPSNQAGIYARINFARAIAKISDKQNVAQILASSVQQAKIIADKRAESYALGSLGELYEQNSQWQEAQNLTEQALSIAQEISASDIAYRWEWQLGRLLKIQGNNQAAIAAYDSAVATLESLRSDLAIANREVQLNFRDRVEPLYRQSVELLLQQQGPEKPDLDKARQRIEALQLAELDNFFREACLNNQFVVLDKVVDRNNPKTAIFYPIILDNQLEVILKLPNQPLMRKTSFVNSNEVEQAIAEMREAIVQPDAKKKFQTGSQQLYNWLIKPVETDLKNSGVTTLVFIPDGSLRNIPMAALYDGKDYFVQHYAVAISPGLQLFTPKPLKQKKLNVLAGGLSQPPQNENFAPLPKVKDELDLIQKLGITKTILLDQNFKSTTLEKKINAQPFRVIHLATHGKFSSKAKDTFILAADKRIYVREFDSLLKSREQNRTEPVELLVLSACETAAGDNRAALGLAGVAIRAGARSTLASLWQIGDDSTALFIGEFYSQLTTGRVTIAEALRLAQLKLLNASEYNRPMYWAPYVLVGNWL